MCGCASVPSPCLQVCVVPKFRHLDPASKFSPNFWLLKRLLFWKTEQSWKSQIPQISDFLKIWIFHWGARLSTFSWMDTVLGYILKKLNLYSLKNLATINFSARTVCLYNGIDFYESMGISERSQIWGVGFPQICSNFRICFGFYFYGLFHSQSSPRGIS